MRAVGGRLRLELAQYRELQVFAQFSLRHGRRHQPRHASLRRILTELLRQKDGEPMPAVSQIELLYAATHTLVPHDTTSERVQRFKREFPAYMEARDPEGVRELTENGVLTPSFEKSMAQAVKEWLARSGAAQ